MADDFEGNGPPPEEASNRTFLIAAAALGGLFLTGLLFIGAYALFIGPRVAAQREAQVATINAQNTAVALAQVQTETAAQITPASPTTVATNTPVLQMTDTPTSVPTITATLGPVTITPAGAALTQTALARTRTPTPTGLPDTGFADEAGIPAMITASLLLIGVLIVARTLRMSNAS